MSYIVYIWYPKKPNGVRAILAHYLERVDPRIRGNSYVFYERQKKREIQSVEQLIRSEEVGSRSATICTQPRMSQASLYVLSESGYHVVVGVYSSYEAAELAFQSLAELNLAYGYVAEWKEVLAKNAPYEDQPYHLFREVTKKSLPGIYWITHVSKNLATQYGIRDSDLAPFTENVGLLHLSLGGRFVCSQSSPTAWEKSIELYHQHAETVPWLFSVRRVQRRRDELIGQGIDPLRALYEVDNEMQ